MHIEQKNSSENNAVIGFAILASILIADKLNGTNFIPDSNDAVVAVSQGSTGTLDSALMPDFRQKSIENNLNK